MPVFDLTITGTSHETGKIYDLTIAGTKHEIGKIYDLTIAGTRHLIYEAEQKLFENEVQLVPFISHGNAKITGHSINVNSWVT